MRSGRAVSIYTDLVRVITTISFTLDTDFVKATRDGKERMEFNV